MHFKIKYHWCEGSLPPPHHYEFTIYISDANGKIEFQPDYSNYNPPSWIENLNIEKNDLTKIQRLCKEVIAIEWIPNENKPVGDSYEWIEIKFENNSHVVPSSVDQDKTLTELYSCIKSLVTENIWKIFNTKRKKYIECFYSDN